MLGFVGSISELSISVPSSPGSGGAQAPQSPIPTPDPPTARRSRVYLADPGRVGSPEKGVGYLSMNLDEFLVFSR